MVVMLTDVVLVAAAAVLVVVVIAEVVAEVVLSSIKAHLCSTLNRYMNRDGVFSPFLEA